MGYSVSSSKSKSATEEVGAGLAAEADVGCFLADPDPESWRRDCFMLCAVLKVLGGGPPSPTAVSFAESLFRFLVSLCPRWLLVLYPKRCIWGIPPEDLLQALSVSET
jgi:hypothetical protein